MKAATTFILFVAITALRCNTRAESVSGYHSGVVGPDGWLVDDDSTRYLEHKRCETWTYTAFTKNIAQATFQVVDLPQGCSMEDVLVTTRFYHPGECESKKGACNETVPMDVKEMCSSQGFWLEPAFNELEASVTLTSEPICSDEEVLYHVVMNNCDKTIGIKHMLISKRADDISCEKAADVLTILVVVLIGVPILGLIIFFRARLCLRLGNAFRQPRHVLVQMQTQPLRSANAPYSDEYPGDTANSAHQKDIRPGLV